VIILRAQGITHRVKEGSEHKGDLYRVIEFACNYCLSDGKR
jgi:hypothetical protein